VGFKSRWRQRRRGREGQQPSGVSSFAISFNRSTNRSGVATAAELALDHLRWRSVNRQPRLFTGRVPPRLTMGSRDYTRANCYICCTSIAILARNKGTLQRETRIDRSSPYPQTVIARSTLSKRAHARKREKERGGSRISALLRSATMLRRKYRSCPYPVGSIRSKMTTIASKTSTRSCIIIACCVLVFLSIVPLRTGRSARAAEPSANITVENTGARSSWRALGS